MLRIILWCDKNGLESSSNEIDSTLREVCPDYWSKSVIPGQSGDHPDKGWQDDAWEQARRHQKTDNLRILEKHLAKSGWFEAPPHPPWTTRPKNAPVIVLFYSFKGGVGRSTALAATALHLASGGERVAVLDADLDAPGVGYLLAGHDRSTAQWGIVDYLLEWRLLKQTALPTDDYYHRYVAPSGVGGDYAEPGEAGDDLWTLSDLESDDAPHVPVVLPYEERLATFRDLSDVAERVLLREGPYRDLAGRLWSSYSQ